MAVFGVNQSRGGEPMFSVTRYLVQPFARRGRQLMAGEVQAYRDRAPAIRAGRMMRRRVAGVAVYKVVGEPGSDLWREPELLEGYGEVLTA